MDTTICYNIDQTFRGTLMLGGAAFTVLSGVSWMCWTTFHNEDVRHVTPEPLSDATERARMTRATPPPSPSTASDYALRATRCRSRKPTDSHTLTLGPQ